MQSYIASPNADQPNVRLRWKVVARPSKGNGLCETLPNAAGTGLKSEVLDLPRLIQEVADRGSEYQLGRSGEVQAVSEAQRCCASSQSITDIVPSLDGIRSPVPSGRRVRDPLSIGGHQDREG